MGQDSNNKSPQQTFLVLLRAEGASIAVVVTLLFAVVSRDWWLFALLFFVPDISMIGYLAGPRIGALSYNVFHTYLTPTVIAIVGFLGGAPIVTEISMIWFAHIGFDRALGYGLKQSSGFKDTHLSKPQTI